MTVIAMTVTEETRETPGTLGMEAVVTVEGITEDKIIMMTGGHNSLTKVSLLVLEQNEVMGKHRPPVLLQVILVQRLRPPCLLRLCLQDPQRMVQQEIQ